jgi:hypothetical protein
VSPEELGAALARIERRQAEIEERLARLEQKAARGPAPSSPPPPAPKPQAPPPRRAALPRFEFAFGLTWISRIAVVTVVLALAFFFEYAFENHWITAAGRVVLGVACGAAALGSGERFRRKGQGAFAQALTAAGIAFLYLSVWAAFGLYGLIAQPAAFGLMVLVTAGAGALALRCDGAAVAMLGLAGGFATPLLLGSGRNPWFVLGYALVLDLAAAFAGRRRRWRWVEVLALAGTAVLYIQQSPAPEGLRTLYTVFVFLFYAVFAASEARGVSIAAQVLAGIAPAVVWSPAAGALWLPVALEAAGLAMASRRRWPAAAAAASFAGFWLAYEAWRVDIGIVAPVAALVPLTAGFLMILAWPVWRARRGSALRLQGLLVLALNAAFYFGLGYALLLPRFGAYEGLFAVAVAVIHGAAARVLWRVDERGSLLAAGAAWVLLALAAPIQFAGYRVTIAWALEGAALAWLGVRLRERRALNAAMAVFVMVVLRLAAADGRMYPDPAAYGALVNARFLAFAVAAGALWAAAWWIRAGRRGAAVYVGGHALLLWGLCLEAAGWAARNAAPANVASVTGMSISVLAGGYAVLLVAAGTGWRHQPTRMLGVVLIGLVILKLYLYDIWLLGNLYRMTAFAILGVLLLVVSYLYSRFRGSIETWWRP